MPALVEEDAEALPCSIAVWPMSLTVLDETAPFPPFQESAPYESKKPRRRWDGRGLPNASTRSLVAIKILRDAWLSPARRERLPVNSYAAQPIIRS